MGNFPRVTQPVRGRPGLNPDSVCNVSHCLPLNCPEQAREGWGGKVLENGE